MSATLETVNEEELGSTKHEMLGAQLTSEINRQLPNGTQGIYSLLDTHNAFTSPGVVLLLVCKMRQCGCKLETYHEARRHDSRQDCQVT